MSERLIALKCQGCGARLDQDRVTCPNCGAVSVGMALRLAKKQGASFAEDHLRNYQFQEFGEDIDDTTCGRLASAVADTFARGGSYDDVVSAIKDVFSKASSVRADMIARTALADAYNGALLRSAKAGTKYKYKSWAPDGQCCGEICQPNVDAGPIPIDEPFPSGHQAPTGHLGCDCSIEFVKAEELPEWVKRAAAKAANAAARRVIDLHFVYHGMIEQNYRDRDRVPDALAIAIDACRKQIALAPRTAAAFRAEVSRGASRSMPSCLGFWQLAVILEKQGNYAEAITLATQALHQGWAGDWEKRIARCNQRLASRTSSVR